MAKQRLIGSQYIYEILRTKKLRNLTYSEIAKWMGLTASNLRAMVSKGINPTADEWRLFQEHLSCPESKLKAVPKTKIITCVCGCGRELIKWAWNSKYFSRQCKNKMRRKHPNTE